MVMESEKIGKKKWVLIMTTLKQILCLVLMCVIASMSIVSAVPVTEQITTSQYWTAPTNVFVIQAYIVGGGGGGSGGNRSIRGPAGTNSTTISLVNYPVVPGQRYYITIGTGGIGGSSPDERVTQTPPGIGAQGLPSTAFGVTNAYAGGGYYLIPKSPNGVNGFSSEQVATNGEDGYGSTTSTIGGTAGIGYGAPGGGGGSGGTGGHGGYGGNGANGVVQITYDIDASDILFSGTTYNALTGAVLPSTTIVFSQGSTSYSVTSSGSTGVFTVPSSVGISTGYSVTETVSKTGYYTETFSFIPYVSQIIPQRVALIPTTFARGDPGTISGIIRDQYGSSISTVDVSMLSTNGSTLSMTSTTAGMYYFTGVPALTTWDATFTKTGYANVTSVFDMGYYP